MKVIIYVPPSPGSARTRRAIEYALRRHGHAIVGVTDSRSVATAALEAGVAQRIAGRPEHLTELVPWALAVPRSARAVAGSAVVLGSAWIGAQARPIMDAAQRQPARAFAGVAALVAVAVFAGLMLAPGGSPRRQARPDSSPPLSPSETTSALPGPGPSARPPSRTPASHQPPRALPAPPGSSASQSAPGRTTPPAKTPAPPATSSSAPSPPRPPAQTSPAPTQTEECFLRLDLLSLGVRVCADQPFRHR